MDYTEWMDGEGGYREWYEANVGSDAETESKPPIAQPNGGPGTAPVPPKPPVKS
jgi:hypothetical protein